MKKIAIFGESGFAKEVADIAVDQGFDNVVYIAAETNNSESNIISESQIGQLDTDYVYAIGAGEPQVREKIYNKFKELKFINLIHSSVTFGVGVLSNMEEKKGLVVCAGVRFTNSIEVGDFSVFNLNVTVGHDCRIGEFVSCMPGCNISGNVKLSKGAFLGTGATILQGQSTENPMSIGENAVVGAGAVVTRSVEENKTVVGAPAKPIN